MEILCSHCKQHILNLNLEKLAWPLDRKMFTPARVFNDWKLSPALIDAYCPLCEQFPFFVDTANGGLAPRLMVRGEDGRATMSPLIELMGKKIASKVEHEFPCPHCGAKKRFHKKGCSVNNKQAGG